MDVFDLRKFLTQNVRYLGENTQLKFAQDKLTSQLTSPALISCGLKCVSVEKKYD